MGIWKRKVFSKFSSFFSFIAVAFILLVVLSLQGTLTGKAVFVLDDEVTADQIATIATLAGPGDETKMLSEIDLDAGSGYIIFSALDDGDSATIKEKDGNIYVAGNIDDAVEVLSDTDYPQLLEDNDGIIEIVNGEIVEDVEEEEEVEQEEKVEEIEAVEEETEEVIVEEEIEEIEEEPTGPYCKQTENGVKGMSQSFGAFSYENSCGAYGTREYATIYSCGSYDRGSRWGGVDYFWQTGQPLCRYGCDDGACKEAEDVLEFSDTCIDSDGGDAFDKVGAVTFNGEVYEDVCAENSDFVYEYSCSSSGTLRKVKQECQYMCETFTNGNCYGGYTKGSPIVLISGEEACKDSDAGDVYDGVGRAGTVTLNGESYADSCEQGKSLIEYSCVDGTELGKRRYTCSYTCADAACPQSYTQGQVETILPVPEEPEKGDCQTTATGVTGTAKTGYTITYENDCSPYTTGTRAYETYYVNSAYCDENNFPALRIYDCEEGYVCSSDGTSCVEKTNYCEDYVSGTDAYVAESVTTKDSSGYFRTQTDYCQDTVVVQYACSGTDAMTTETTCPYGCVGGRCLYEDEEIQYTSCYEQDAGRVPDTYGTLSLYTAILDSTDYGDYCVDADTVMEYFCTEDTTLYTTEQIDCTGGCYNGECKTDMGSAITTVDAFLASTQDWYYDMKIVIPNKGSTSDYLAALALVGKYAYPLVKDTEVSDWRTIHAIVVGSPSVNTVSKAVIDAGATKEGAYYVYQDPTYYGTILVVGSDDPKETRKAVKELVKK